MALGRIFLVLVSLVLLVCAQCPDYTNYANQQHGPFSSGRYNLSYQRPSTECRTASSADLENEILRLKSVITDPDLSRLFENAWPNTLDTAIRWHGTGNDSSAEELTFIITGDINAMWLRDSANQMQSYRSLLKPSSDSGSIASLWRGVINLQARYISVSPYCNSFQPPTESKIAPGAAGQGDTVYPNYDPTIVYECKYELDSLAAFLQVSSEYFQSTNDVSFFGKYKWVQAIQSIMQLAKDMQTPTYAPNGQVNASPYTFTRTTTRATETLSNDGIGNPVQNGTGLIRSAFRPSDDSTIYQLFIPANMMFSRYLDSASQIMAQLPGQNDLASQMKSLSAQLRSAIAQHGIITDSTYGHIYAYEVDGFGSSNIMDDANIPSLLAAPLLGYLNQTDNVYQNTRKMILSAGNPYFMRGPIMNAVGGPHVGPGNAWPMASIVRILTSTDDGEITTALKEIVSSTAGLGLIHESVSTFNPGQFTRQW